MDRRASELVLSLATASLEFMKGVGKPWDRAYVRFQEADGNTDASASYVRGDDVTIVSAVREGPFFDKVLEFANELRGVISPPAATAFVCLLILDSNLDYRVKYEFKDTGKWKITKLNGGSGIPVGLDQE